MQYTPYASPMRPGSVERSPSNNDSDDSDFTSDGSGDCIPASSSTLLPSSPFVVNSPRDSLDGVPVKATRITPDADDSIYALGTCGNGRSRLSEELEHWFSTEPIKVSRLDREQVRPLSTTLSHQSGSERLTSGSGISVSPSGYGSSDERSDTESQSLHAEESQHAYSKRLDTRKAQEKFSHRLCQLLLRVVEQQARQSQESISRYPSSVVSVAEAAINQPLDASSESTSAYGALITANASDSLYAADISDFGTTSAVSASSWSVSGCSAASVSCSSSFSSSSSSSSAESQYDYDIQTPVRYAGRYVYYVGSESEAGDSSSPSEYSLDEDAPGFHVFPIVDSVTSLHTPMARLLPSSVPTAPKKVQHRIRIQSDDVQIGSCQSARKRPRSDSQSITSCDPPAQDNISRDETTWAVIDDHSDSKHTEACHGSTRKESVRERSNLLAKRRRLSVNTGRSKRSESNSMQLAIPPNTLASFRRAASMRSEIEVSNVLNQPEDVQMTEDPATDARIDIHARLNEVQNPSTLVRENQDTPRPKLSVIVPNTEVYCAPTRPVTPVTRSRFNDVTPTDSPLPILAPPPFEFIPKPPASKEEEAEVRIQRLKEKEMEQRTGDGLLSSSVSIISHDLHVTAERDNDERMMWKAVGDLETYRTETDRQAQEILGEDRFDELEVQLGIDEDFRADVVDWILDVKPPSHRSKPLICANLRAQLADCPDTRWQAAHLFTRYFLRMGASPNSPPVSATKKSKLAAGGGGDTLDEREAVAWDCAVACLACAVKLHRDFLVPLFPVIADEYLLIAPHVMTYDDLEAAQREVFQAFSFCLGSSTPGAYIEEIYNALPTLRTFVDTHGNWDVARSETWEILYDCLIDPDYIRRPVHLLTGCSLIFGIAESLTLKLKAEHAMTLHSIATGRAQPQQRTRRSRRCECQKFKKKARKAVRDIEHDVREVLGVSVDTWDSCIAWLNELLEC